jgi:hypothetical protein
MDAEGREAVTSAQRNRFRSRLIETIVTFVIDRVRHWPEKTKISREIAKTANFRDT